jgi:glycosyltransferase involved in cell wall biosynthesis
LRGLLAELPWRLTIAGDLTRDPDEAARLQAGISQHKVTSRIAVLGAVSSERLAALYDDADLFVLASRFEGYGMAYAEALSHGLPVIGTTAGAIPDTVPQEAGLLVTSGDMDALARALRRVIADADLRRRLSDAAWAARERCPPGSNRSVFAPHGLMTASPPNGWPCGRTMTYVPAIDHYRRGGHSVRPSTP